jgi:hypothetical protein
MPDNERAPMLPDPPPARPASRRAAIDAALLRFDGAETTPSKKPGSARTAAWAWPQLGGLATAGLVAVVSASLWLSRGSEFVPQREAEPVQTEEAVPLADTLGSASPGPTAMAAPDRVAAKADPLASNAAKPSGARIAPTPDRTDSKEVPRRAEPTAAMEPEPLPAYAPAPAPPPSVAVAAAEPMAEAAAGRARSAEEEKSRDQIVVTGSRVANPPRRAARAAIAQFSARKTSVRGDWNVCTVDDPHHDLGACTHLVGPGAQGAEGRAAAQISEGLSRAWRGDLRGAIAAFDRSIERSGRSSFAYLNRGLVRARAGDSDQALADLDRAIRYAPREARGYYHRSLLLEQRGDAAKAQRDAATAVKLDPAYRAVID